MANCYFNNDPPGQFIGLPPCTEDAIVYLVALGKLHPVCGDPDHYQLLEDELASVDPAMTALPIRPTDATGAGVYLANLPGLAYLAPFVNHSA